MRVAQPKAKRQHHVNPQFYLRKFQCEEGEDLIWVYDSESGDAKKVPIKVAAVQKDYYSFVNPDGLRDTECVENFIANIEGHAATVFRKFSTGSELSDDDRRTFALSVSLFIARAPATRRQTAELLAMTARTIGRASAMDSAHFRESFRQMEDHKGVPEEDRVSDEELEETRIFVLGDGYTLEVAQEVTLLPLAHLLDVAEIIRGMRWARIHAPEGSEFITSDSPVVREIPPQRHHPLMGPGLMNPFIQVSLPLSPNLTWLGTWDEDLPESAVARKEFVKLLNKLRAVHAERFLYSRTYRSGVAKLGAKFFDSGWKLAVSGFGFKGEPIETQTFKSKSKGIAPPGRSPPIPRGQQPKKTDG